MENIHMPRRLGNLSLNTAGYQECESLHSYSIAFSDRFLIHYVISGRGKFRCAGQEYSLSAGNAFLIGNSLGWYEADRDDPWTYAWINISGEAAVQFIRKLGLDTDDPVYRTEQPEEVAGRFMDFLESTTGDNDYKIYGSLFTLFGLMQESNEKKVEIQPKNADRYVEECLEYIHSNYYRGITVKDLCSYIGLEYSYLFRLFKTRVSKSPGQYLIDYKLAKAEQLLTETEMTVGEVAKTVGYEDRIVMTKAFVQKYGMSPSNYRKNKISLDED